MADTNKDPKTSTETESHIPELGAGVWNTAWIDNFLGDLQSIRWPNMSQMITDLNGVVYFKSSSSLWMCALVNAKIDVVLKNTIVQTALIGRKGTVKEYVCAQDYDITMSGLLVGSLKNTPPLDILFLLRQCIEDDGYVIVGSPYLLTFGITKLVLKEYSIPQGNTSSLVNTKEYKLSFISDSAINLTIL